MSFDTTFGIDPDYSGLSHPSLFQNPASDINMVKNIDIAKATDPGTLWRAQNDMLKKSDIDRSSYTVPYDKSDPPLSKYEKQNLIKKLDPVMEITIDNYITSMLFYFFFSKPNVAGLQRTIRYSVNQWSGFHIGEQSQTELRVIMEQIFSKKAHHVDESASPSKYLLKHVKKEIARLNELVIQETVPSIVDKVEQHVAYMKRVDNPISATSLERPMDTRITGTKVFRSPTDLLNNG